MTLTHLALDSNTEAVACGAADDAPYAFGIERVTCERCMAVAFEWATRDLDAANEAHTRRGSSRSNAAEREAMAAATRRVVRVSVAAEHLTGSNPLDAPTESKAARRRRDNSAAVAAYLARR